MTAILVLAAPLHSLLTGTVPADLLGPRLSAPVLLSWMLIGFGASIRLWGSGNLRKNQEITRTGVYVLVRHPLYTGSLSLFLAYFLTVGSPGFGLLLFVALVGFVYYPTMLGEEEYLTLKFPAQFSRYRPPPRLLPDLRKIPEALRTDQFQLEAARRNLGFRSFSFLLFLPLFLRALGWLQLRAPF
ncbi:MAG: hypothetical protein GEU90_08245 [Gemmatimonas sp.]|nr:hypothetical protein [Gemmatimonas sp.]